jgi:hypothetical protein
MILRPDRASAGVDNVWAVGTIADSSVRKIVVAGDSLARTAALAEATARQAAQDSITRDSLRKAGVPEQMIVPDTTPAMRRPVIRRDSVRPDTAHRDTVRRVPVRRDTAVIPHRP